MGVVFQSFHLIPTMTAIENVATPLELAGDLQAFARAAAELEAMGLGARLDHYPAQLSGGEQQRVALARAAVTRPEILLADEPTGNLDGATGEAIIRLLFALRDRHGATLVLVTHAPEIAGRCDRVIRLRDGALRALRRGRRMTRPPAPAAAAPAPSPSPPVSYWHANLESRQRAPAGARQQRKPARTARTLWAAKAAARRQPRSSC